MANHTLNQAMEARRSIYAIGKDISVSQKEIQGVIEHALTYVPSAFNGQSPRIVLLYGEGPRQAVG
ncbi:MAG: hypothetical protein LKE39_09960 [Sphaerochaeta sp.]|nr:hypothetical protein [Sphaerochaeta sp.]